MFRGGGGRGAGRWAEGVSGRGDGQNYQNVDIPLVFHESDDQNVDIPLVFHRCDAQNVDIPLKCHRSDGQNVDIPLVFHRCDAEHVDIPMVQCLISKGRWVSLLRHSGLHL